MGKVFVTGRRNSVARLEGYEPQKAMGRFTPEQIAKWLGPDVKYVVGLERWRK